MAVILKNEGKKWEIDGNENEIHETILTEWLKMYELQGKAEATDMITGQQREELQEKRQFFYTLLQ